MLAALLELAPLRIAELELELRQKQALLAKERAASQQRTQDAVVEAKKGESEALFEERRRHARAWRELDELNERRASAASQIGSGRHWELDRLETAAELVADIDAELAMVRARPATEAAAAVKQLREERERLARETREREARIRELRSRFGFVYETLRD